MNILKSCIYLIVYMFVFITTSCEDQNCALVGTWELIDGEGCDTSFLELNPFIYPYVKYGHKIYFSDSLLFNPSAANERTTYLPFEEKYYLQGNQVLVSSLESFTCYRKDSVLVLQQGNCRLTFERINANEKFNSNKYNKIAYSVRDDNDNILDSIQLFNDSLWILDKSLVDIDLNQEEVEKYASYVFKIAANIDSKYLNSTYDEGVMDNNKHTIILYSTSGKRYNIVSYGQYETPFEVNILKSYLLKLGDE